MAPVEPNQQPDDFGALIAHAQQEMGDAVARAGLRNDAYRYVMLAQCRVLDVYPAFLAEISKLRQQPSAEISAGLIDAVGEGACKGMRAEARRMIRTLDRRLSVQIGLAVGAAYVLGAVSLGAGLFALHVARPDILGVRTGDERCTDQPDGARFCWQGYYTRLPAELRH